MDNYRLISTQHSLKLPEKVVANRLAERLMVNSNLSTSQLGHLSGQSTNNVSHGPVFMLSLKCLQGTLA
jgi:hypothetical protein